MREWLDRLAGPEYTAALIWTLAALVLLVILLAVFRLLRNLTAGTFVAGGRNRKTRLAVMDATAVDSHRRLVLVRRDDVEHLLLIGGPTDVVVEPNIRLHGQARRPAPPQADPTHERAPVRPVERPWPPEAPRQPRDETPRPQAPTEPRTARPAAAAPPARPAAEPRQTHKPATEPAQTDRSAAGTSHTPRPAPLSPKETHLPVPPSPPTDQPLKLGPFLGSRVTPTAAPPSPPTKPSVDIDDALLEELETSLENGAVKKSPPKPKELSLEDEMSRLLGELSGHKR